MEINVRENQGVTVFDLSGRIIGSDSNQLKETIDQSITQSETPKLLFNLSGVSMLDSTALGTLVGSHLSASRKGGRIGIINVAEGAQSILIIAKLVSVLERFESEAEAVDALSSS